MNQNKYKDAKSFKIIDQLAFKTIRKIAWTAKTELIWKPIKYRIHRSKFF